MLSCLLVAFYLCNPNQPVAYYASPPSPPTYYAVPPPVYTYPPYAVAVAPPVVVRFDGRNYYHHGWRR